MRVLVVPEHGGDIASVVEKAGGRELLFQTPWGRPDRRHLGFYPDSRTAWMAAYGGGWQVLCPNGGDESEGPGVRWGYHGEASTLPWRVLTASDRHTELEVALTMAPLRLRRRLALDRGVLRIDERLSNESADAVDVMWVQHPAFGAPLIGPGARLELSARTVWADAELVDDILPPDGRWTWPIAADRAGRPVDLSLVPPPGEPRALLAYLEGFDRHEASIVNDRQGLRVSLRWCGDTWPLAWLWQELHATAGYPWFRRAYVVAIEPASTAPAWGAARAADNGGKLVRLVPHGSRDAWIELEVTGTEAPAPPS